MVEKMSNPQEATVKCVILIHSNPQSREAREGFAESEQAVRPQVYAELVEELAASGELIVTEALADPSLARSVTVQDGRTMASDGPFAETKGQLAGFILVECESIERAIEIAGRIPEAPLGLVELWPVLDLGGLEM
jgi:hypothetical protein